MTANEPADYAGGALTRVLDWDTGSAIGQLVPVRKCWEASVTHAVNSKTA